MVIYKSIRKQIVLLILFTGLLLVLAGSQAARAVPVIVDAKADWTEIGPGSASGGGISSSKSDSHEPALVTFVDKAIVAWEEAEAGSDSEIYVRHWTGAAWIELDGSASDGGISNNLGNSFRVALAVDANERPIVAWEDISSGNREIYVKRWSGQAWVEIGNKSASEGGISNNDSISSRPALVHTPDSIVVAWEDTVTPSVKGPNVYEIYVKRWIVVEGHWSWEPMGSGSATEGGISNSDGDAFTPSVAVLPDGKPIIAWADTGSGNGEIYLKRWDGKAWQEFSSGSASGVGISNTPGYSYRASLIIDPDGWPIVAWEDNSFGDYEIYLKRWDGNAWLEMGSSASKGGISNTAEDSIWPSLAIDPKGAPVVAWQEGKVEAARVYVKRWNEDAGSWEEMDSGSASGGGISDEQPRHSLLPSLAFTAEGTAIVAWESMPEIPGSLSGHNLDYEYGQIYARRHVPCYSLTLEHTGQGSDPVPSPPNSTDCPTGSFTAGQQITLSAIPASGWQVTGWAGTDDDASSASDNQLTMPASDHTASVAYGRILNFLPLIVDHDCYMADQEIEPNNHWLQANGPLCNGTKTLIGWPNDNEDYFMLDVQQVGDISVTVVDHHDGGAQLRLYKIIVDRGKKVEKLLELDKDPVNGRLHVEYDLAEPGRYFIIIYTKTPNPNEEERYTMQVEIP